jgi:hypothetical protein
MRNRNIIAAIMSARGSEAPPPAGVPVNSVAPVISGTLLWGNELTTTNGTWSNSPTGYTYQWKRNGSNISGATANTYITTLADWNQDITCEVTASNVSGSGTPAASNTLVPTTTEADLFHTTITVADGEANTFIRTPLHLHQPPAEGWPVVLWYNGDGGNNNVTTVVSGQAMSTSDNLTYTFASSVQRRRVVAKTVRVKVNGVAVGFGQFGGAITGTGITTGTVGGDLASTTNAAFSVTFSSSQAGNTITLDYVHSATFIEGVPQMVNRGDDFDERCIFIAVQNIGSGDYNRDYFDNVITYAFVNHDINIKRIYTTGLSRGGVFILETSEDSGSNNSLYKTRNKFWVHNTTGVVVTTDPEDEINYTETGLSAIAVAAPAYGTSFDFVASQRIGAAVVHGTSDSTVANVSYGIANAGNNFNLIERPQILNLWGVNHNTTCWHTNFAHREFANGGIPQDADWDYVDFLLKFSYDDIECATLHVEQAEKRRYGTEKDIIDWRKANRRVQLLGAGAEKTALLARLASLYDDIADGGVYYLINFHNFGNNAPNPPFNNMTTMNGSQSILNIVDEEGGASAIDLTLTNDHADAGSARLTWSNRTAYVGGLSEYASNSGFKVISTNSTFAFGSLPAGTYNIRIYTNENSGNWTTQAQLSVTIDGVTKTKFSPDTLIGYIEYTNLDAADLASFTAVRGAARDVGISFIEIYKHP